MFGGFVVSAFVISGFCIQSNKIKKKTLCLAVSQFLPNSLSLLLLLGVFGGEEEEGGVMSGPGAARTILLFSYH